MANIVYIAISIFERHEEKNPFVSGLHRLDEQPNCRKALGFMAAHFQPNYTANHLESFD